MARTSDKVSSLAARYAGITPDELLLLAASDKAREQTATHIRSMAASLLRQDEQKGLRKLLRRFMP